MGAQDGAGDRGAPVRSPGPAWATRGTERAGGPGPVRTTGSVSVQEALEGIVEDPRDSAGRALAPTGRAVRRWPWAVGAAVAGAAAAAAAVVLTRGLLGRDAPGAQEPDQLRAVVDLGTQAPAADGADQG